MNRIIYSVTGSALDHAFGILGTDQITRHSAVTMPFLKDRLTVERIVCQLNALQMPIPEFCEYYMSGELEQACKGRGCDS